MMADPATIQANDMRKSLLLLLLCASCSMGETKDSLKALKNTVKEVKELTTEVKDAIQTVKKEVDTLKVDTKEIIKTLKQN